MEIKRPFWLLSLLWPLVLPLALYLADATGSGFWYWLVPVEMYVLLPILDELIGDARFDANEVERQRLENDNYFRVLTILTVPLHLFAMLLASWYVSVTSLHWYDTLGILLSLGLNNALAINTAHELGHKNTQMEKWLAKFLLALPVYGHFYVEHNRGHHRHVATAEDASSARMGESLYRYVIRDVPGELQRAWLLEYERLHRKGQRAWGLHNELMQSWLISLGLYTSLVSFFGLALLPFLLLQALFAWFEIATANYIEHYGLMRQKDETGKYLPCRPEHSWNSNRLLSGLVLFNLQLHSDHHANAGRRYQALASHKDAPTLPGGYPLMFILALVPSLWRAVMDKRLLVHYGGDVMRVNRVANMRTV
jgi:alkane 1-monooxygenase